MSAESPYAPDRLRVGVILEPGDAPEWVLRILADLRAGADVDLVEVVRDAVPTAGALPALLHDIQQDHARVAEAPDPMALRPLTYAEGTGSGVAMPLDLVLDFGGGSGPLVPSLLGTWSLRFGGARLLKTSAALFQEVARGDTWCDLVLLCAPAGAAPVVIARTTSHVNDRSLWRTRAPVAWKARALVRRCLADLRRLGSPAFFAAARARYDQTVPPEPAPVTAGALAAFRLRHLFRRFLVPYFLVRDQWRIGIRLRTPHDPPWGSRAWARGFRFIEAPPERFYADPFLFERDGRTFLFFEDWDWAVGKAIISVAELAADGTLGPVAPALETAYHLSNPLVFAADGEIYMIPETLAARRVEVYRAVDFPTRWELHCVPLDGLDIVDPCVVQDGARWWMFAAVLDFGGSGWDELYVFSADALCGPWQPVGEQPVLSDVRAARPGGRMWRKDGVLQRLAQNCAGGYGAGLGLYAVEQVDAQGYRQRTVAEVNAFDFGMNGVHAYDATSRFEVVDGRHYQMAVRGWTAYWPFPRWFGKH